MAKIISIANQKGGVAKTTTTVNLGAALAEAHQRVLLIDLDPQAHLALSLGLNPDDLDASTFNVLAEPSVGFPRIITPISEGLALAPADINLSVAEQRLGGTIGREQILRDKLREVQADYDYILIDCPPSLGVLTVNALAASQRVIIPVQAHYLSMKGMQLLIETIGLVREKLNPQLEILGILLTMVDVRTRISNQAIEALRGMFGDKVFRVMIRQNTKVIEASARGVPVLKSASSSPPAQAYRQLAREVLSGQEAGL
ncbi:MAG TPA: ParA family protein [Armatimonadota bacterium]|nr:ParA family protein [Armatimonadota bacterium]HOM82489.1 ParA family protein [Armatimonadota bacterium]HOQ27921.1 ParA family protein [Armatimonadota bacterium]